MAKKANKANSQNRPVLLAAVPCGLTAFYFMLKADTSIYLIILTTLLLTALIHYGVLLAQKKENHQLAVIDNLLEAVIEGDYSLRGKMLFEEEIYSQILTRINSLANTLSKQNVQSRERQLLLGKITDQIDVAVLVLDSNDHITLANPAACRLMGHNATHLQDATLTQLGLSVLLESNEKRVLELEFNGTPGNYYIYTDHFIEDGQARQLIFITDIQRILRAEERKAWQSLLRVLSHEINNSLSPIGSISDTLARILKKQNEVDREGLLEGLSVIKERSQSLSHFIERYRQFTGLPEPDKRPIDLKEMMESLRLLFTNREISLESSEKLVLRADPHQIQQLLVNLLKNADEAMPDPAGKISINWKQTGDYIHIQIEDEGVGLASSENLFVPFYTTKSQGSGIGLALCRQIAFNHHGDIILKNRDGGKGVEVVITIPGDKHDSMIFT